ncbi:MAG: AzlD domain-containing protein, partial [Actinomycetota bacterium]
LILLLADRTLPATIERALRNVGPAVLAALTISLAIGPDGVGSVQLAEAGALLAAVGMALWRRNLMLTFVAGMVTLWVLGALT